MSLRKPKNPTGALGRLTEVATAPARLLPQTRVLTRLRRRGPRQIPPDPRNRVSTLADADRSGHVASSGASIFWTEYGPVDAETTVVFVHGFTLSSESFFFQVRHMRQRWPDVRLLLMDLRGHGRSEHVGVEECTIDLAAEDVLAVIRARADSGRLVLLGHSLGGPVSLATVRRAEPAVAERIAGLIEIATCVEEMADAGVAMLLNTPLVDLLVDYVEKKPASAFHLRERIAGAIAPVLAVGVFMRSTDPEIIDFHAQLINETPTSTIIGFVDDLQTHQEVEAARKLQDTPGYVIVGELDHVVPLSQSERLVELWPKSYLQVSQGAGHMIPLEAPEQVNMALDRLLAVELGEKE